MGKYFNFTSEQGNGESNNIPEAWRSSIIGSEGEADVPVVPAAPTNVAKPAPIITKQENLPQEQPVTKRPIAPKTDDNKDEKPLGYGEYLYDFENTEGRNDVPDLIESAVKNSDIYKKYMYTKEDVLLEAKKISVALDIPVNAIINTPETLDKAREIYNYRKKITEIDPGGVESVDMNKLYQAYPELKTLADKDENSAAVALSNMENVKQVHGIISGFKSQWEVSMMNNESGLIGWRGMLDQQNPDDMKRYNELQKKMKLAKEVPDFLDDPMTSIAAGMGNALGLMGRNFLAAQERGAQMATAGALLGASAGATMLGVGAAPGAIGGAVKGYSAGITAGMMEDMAKIVIGNDYMEFKSYKDKNGNPVLTDGEAKAYAVIAGGLETGIEFWHMPEFLKVLGAGDAALEVGKIVAKYKEKDSIKVALAVFLKNKIKDIRNSAVGEMKEEGIQEFSNEAISNIMAANHPASDIPRYAIGDMIVNSINSAIQAGPASIGLALAGASASSVGAVRTGANVTLNVIKQGRDSVNTMIGEINGRQMLNELRNNLKENDWYKKDKEAVTEVIRSGLVGSGKEEVHIDTELVLDNEGGGEILKQIGLEAGMTEQEIQEKIDNKEELVVPTEIFCQVGISDEQNNMLQSYITFDPTSYSVARIKEYAARMKREMDNLLKLEDRQYLESVENAISNKFSDPEQQAIASYIFAAYPDDPVAGIEDEIKRLKTEREEMLRPFLEDIENGSGNGVQIYANDEGKYMRASNNELWYTEWYKEHQRSMTKADKEELAYRALCGDDTYGLAPTRKEEDSDWFDERKQRYDSAGRNLDIFRAIKDTVAEIKKSGEIENIKGLSKEGYAVFKKVSESVLKYAPNAATRKAATLNAIMLARFADRKAENMRKIPGYENVTALDAVSNLSFEYGGTYDQRIGGLKQRIINEQVAEVRNKYQGTEQWMKAPNGKPTNLTEDQWLWVRTGNFKAWFGDWENNPKNASKVVDENGEPLVQYHGTEAFGFDVFRTKEENGNHGSHFGTKSQASVFVNNDSNIYNVFLNIKNPWEAWDYFADQAMYAVDDIARMANSINTPEAYKILDSLKEDFPFVTIKDDNARSRAIEEFAEEHDYDDINDADNSKVDKAYRAMLKIGGYDGVKYQNMYEDGEHLNDSWIVQNSNQIKSATDNNGAFSLYDDSIYRQDSLVNRMAAAQAAADAFTENASDVEKLDIVNKVDSAVNGMPVLELNVLSAKEPKGREYLRDRIIENWGEDAVQPFFDFLDKAIELVDEVAKQEKELQGTDLMERWQSKEAPLMMTEDGPVPVTSGFKSNGDYAYNYDFGTLCIKSEGIVELMKIIRAKGLFNKLKPLQYQKCINLLAKYSVAIPCKACFVNGKRVKVGVDALKQSFEWQSVLRAAGIKDDFKLGDTRNEITPEQLALLERMADSSDIVVDGVTTKAFQEAYKELMPEDRRRTKRGNLDEDSGITPDKMQRIASIMLERKRIVDEIEKIPPKERTEAQIAELQYIEDHGGVYGLIGELDASGLSEDEYTTMLKTNYADTSLGGLLGGWFGAGTAKPIESHAVYHNLSWRKDFNEAMLAVKNAKTEEERAAKYAEARKKFYAIGGFRMQSVSDFNAYQILDVIQALLDLEVRQLPIHTYTKVPAEVRLLDGSGVKFNMSIFPNAKPAEAVPDDHLGLRRWKEGDGEADYVDENKEKWMFDFAKESFPPEDAFELRAASDGDAGTILVGISDQHVLAGLRSNKVDMVIPYHASNMPMDVKMLTGFNHATDYTEFQETHGIEEGMPDFNFNEVLHYGEYMDGDQKIVLEGEVTPKAVADEYKAWCERHHYTPKFEQFKDEENYYKLLEDFRVYKNDGTVAHQQAVHVTSILKDQARMESFRQTLAESIGERSREIAHRNEVFESEEFQKELEAIFEYEPLDGEVRKRMFRALTNALGADGLRFYKSEDYNELLTAVMVENYGEGEGQRKAVELLHNTQGEVIGFAEGGKVYLNEEYINANTPAHEFTHLWVKVARERAPQAWAALKQELKAELENNEELQAVWNQVENELNADYQYINHLDESVREDAFISEVLARIVGKKNEGIIRALAGNQKLQLDENGDFVLDENGMPKTVEGESAKTSKGAQLVQKIWKLVSKLFAKAGLFMPQYEFSKAEKKELDKIHAMFEAAKPTEKELAELDKKAQDKLKKQRENEVKAKLSREQKALLGLEKKYYAKSMAAFTPSELKRYEKALTIPAEKRTANQNKLIERVETERAKVAKALKGMSYSDYVNMVLKDLWGEESSKRFREQAKIVFKNSKKKTPKPAAANSPELMIAYHGSPYRFNKFNLQAIGTGEGGAAHGWGLYFALDMETAEKYRDNLSEVNKNPINYNIGGTSFELKYGDDSFTVNGEKISDDDIVEALYDLSGELSKNDVSSADVSINERLEVASRAENSWQEHFEKNPGKMGVQMQYERWHSVANGYEKLLKYGSVANVNREKLNPTLYEVDIPDPEVMLDEDADFDEQEKIVQDAVVDILGDEALDMNGRKIYRAIAKKLDSARAASLALRERGVQGIIYYGRRDGDCAVVFDDEAIKILDQTADVFLQKNGDTQGAYSNVNPGKKVIYLFNTADESTMAHELGHYFLQELKELAEMQGAPKQVVRDWETIKKWLNWQEGQTKLTEAQQEQWARAWEGYLREGRAPATSLQRVFASFKRWLTTIYRDAKMLGVEASPDVKRVMDRLLATQEEIDYAMERADYESFERAGGMAYMPASTQELYKSLIDRAREEANAKVLKIAMKDISEDYEDKKKKYLEEKEAETRGKLQRQPVFFVQEYLDNNPDLSLGDVLGALGITYEEYKENLDKWKTTNIESVVADYVRMYDEEKGKPDQETIRQEAEKAIATGEYQKLVTAMELQELEKINKAQKRLDKMVRNKTGEDTKAEAEKALKDLDEREKSRAGLRAYRDAANGLYRQIKEYVNNKLEDMSIKDANDFRKWQRLSKQAQDKAAVFMVKGDWEGAAKAKRQQLVYDEFASRAIKNGKEVERIVNNLTKKITTMEKNKNLGALDRYLFNHMLYVFGMTAKDAPVPPNYKSFTDTMMGHDETLENPYVDENGNLNLPDWLVSAVAGDTVYKGGYTNLSNSTFKDVAGIMKVIYKLGLEANKLRYATDIHGNKLGLDEALAVIANEAAKETPFILEEDITGFGNMTLKDRVYNQMNSCHISLEKAETTLRKLGDAAYRFIYEPLKEAAIKELKDCDRLSKQLDEMFSVYTEKEMLDVKHKVIAKLGTSKLTKENLIMLALNFGTEINKKRVMDGHGVTEGEIVTALKHLDKRDWELVARIWDLYEQRWPELVRVEAEATGAVLQKQEAIPFKVLGNDGNVYNLQGGYFPLKYDPLKSVIVNERAADAATMAGTAAAAMSVGKSMTKERVQGDVRLPLRRDFGVISESLIEQAHLIAMRLPIKDARRIILNKEFAEIVQQHLGLNAYGMLRKWSADCWAQESASKTGYDKAMQFFRSNQTMSVLGFRTMTALLNILNVFPMSDYLTPARAIAAVKNYYAHPFEQRALIFSKSAFMGERAETIDKDIAAAIKDKGAYKNMIPGYQFLQESAFKFIAETDLMLANPLWLSEYQRVYQEGMEAKRNPEEVERDAVNAGDAAVRRVFGSGLKIDQAAVQKSETMKMFTMYYSYFSTLYNALDWSVHKGAKAKYQGADMLKSMAPIASGLLFWVLLPALGEALIRPLSDDDKDKWEPNKIAKRIISGVASNLSGGIPILRDAIPEAINYIMGERTYGFSRIPALAFFDQLFKVYKTVDKMSEGKKDGIDLARDVLRTFDAATGFSTTVTDALTTFLRYADNNFDDDVTDFLRAVIFDKKLK